MKKAEPKQKPLTEKFKVGIYQLGYQWVELWLDPTLGGGNFVWMPGDCHDPKKPKAHSQITVGTEGDQYLWQSWGILTHEAAESVMCDLGVRFRPTGHYTTTASDLYTFYFNHNEFTEIACRVGSFLCEVRADFEAAWKKLKRHGNHR